LYLFEGCEKKLKTPLYLTEFQVHHRHISQYLKISRNIGICWSSVGRITPWYFQSHPPREKQHAFSLVFSGSV